MKKYKVINNEGYFLGYIYTNYDIEFYHRGSNEDFYFKELIEDITDGY